MKFASDAKAFEREGKPDLARLAREEAIILEEKALAVCDEAKHPRTYRITKESLKALREKASA